MDVAIRAAALRARRMLLVALFFGLAWFALSILIAPASASASDERGSGLTGIVGDVAAEAAEVTHTTVATVEKAAAHAAPVVPQATAPLPAPVPPVSQPVREIAAQVDAVVVETVDTTTQAVTEVAQSRPVSAVVAPVTAVVVETPVVGEVVQGVGLDEALPDVAASVDDTLDDVVGTTPPAGGLLPEPVIPPTDGTDPVVDGVDGPSVPAPSAPVPAASSPSSPGGDSVPATGDAERAEASTALLAERRALFGDAREFALVRGAAAPSLPLAGVPGSETPDRAVASSDGGAGSSTPGAPGSAPAGSSSASSSMAGTGAVEASLSDGSPLHVSSHPSASTPDDALPGSPVFDTDISPD